MTSPTYIGTPPQQFVIPVTLNADREFTINRWADATYQTPVDWAAVVFMEIDLSSGTVTIDATVTGNQATVLLPSTTCDQVKASTKWRLYMQTGTAPDTLTTPICVGTFERDDGN